MAPKSKSKLQDATHSKAQPVAPQRPDWPSFTPLIPTADLVLESLVPDQIILIRNLWTSTLCKNYVSFLSTLPLVTTPNKPKKGNAVRVNDRFQVEDAQFAKQLWEETALRSLVSDAAVGETKLDWGGDVVSPAAHIVPLKSMLIHLQMGLNPNIRIYRYTKGQFFDQHCKRSQHAAYKWAHRSLPPDFSHLLP